MLFSSSDCSSCTDNPCCCATRSINTVSDYGLYPMVYKRNDLKFSNDNVYSPSSGIQNLAMPLGFPFPLTHEMKTFSTAIPHDDDVSHISANSICNVPIGNGPSQRNGNTIFVHGVYYDIRTIANSSFAFSSWVFGLVRWGIVCYVPANGVDSFPIEGDILSSLGSDPSQNFQFYKLISFPCVSYLAGAARRFGFVKFPYPIVVKFGSPAVPILNCLLAFYELVYGCGQEPPLLQPKLNSTGTFRIYYTDA